MDPLLVCSELHDRLYDITVFNRNDFSLRLIADIHALGIGIYLIKRLNSTFVLTFIKMGIY